MERKVVAAAIKFYQNGYEYPIIMCGRRHSDIFQQMLSLGIKYNKETYIQSFLTNENQFVDRYNAFYVALKANQILKDSDAAQKFEKAKTYKELHSIPLYSEDVW